MDLRAKRPELTDICGQIHRLDNRSLPIQNGHVPAAPEARGVQIEIPKARRRELDTHVAVTTIERLLRGRATPPRAISKKKNVLQP